LPFLTSAAAYLVDLFDFMGSGAAPPAGQAPRALRNVPVVRKHEDAMPYIDLVNEVLEAAVLRTVNVDFVTPVRKRLGQPRSSPRTRVHFTRSLRRHLRWRTSLGRCHFRSLEKRAFT